MNIAVLSKTGSSLTYEAEEAIKNHLGFSETNFASGMGLKKLETLKSLPIDMICISLHKGRDFKFISPDEFENYIDWASKNYPKQDTWKTAILFHEKFLD